MIKVMIVDDEKETREGLRQLVNWDGLGVSQVATADSGEEAMRLCVSFIPDIVVSDIRMPGMSGIELCTYIGSLLPGCQIVFISAFANKEYLKAAIQLEAVGYVEKPINIGEMEQALRKAVERHRQQKTDEETRHRQMVNLPMLQEMLILNLISGHVGENLEEELHGAKLFAGQSFFRVLFFKRANTAMERQTFEQRLRALVHEVFGACEYVTAFRDDRQAVVVVAAPARTALHDYEPGWERLRQAVRDWDGGAGLFCSVGFIEQGAERIAFSYRSAVIALQKLFYVGYGATLFYREELIGTLDGPDDTVRRYSECLLHRELNEALALLERLYGRLRQNSTIPVAAVRNVYMGLGFHILQSRKGAEEESERPAEQSYTWERVQEFDTLAEIHDYMCEVTRRLLESTEENMMVQKVRRIIGKQYGSEELTVQVLADQAYVTPSYLSRVFKQETGKTIGQYITEVRIEHAKELLLDNKLKLYHVAMLVGYNNPSYFAKTFKKAVGVMPSVYRERMGS